MSNIQPLTLEQLKDRDYYLARATQQQERIEGETNPISRRLLQREVGELISIARKIDPTAHLHMRVTGVVHND